MESMCINEAYSNHKQALYRHVHQGSVHSSVHLPMARSSPCEAQSSRAYVQVGTVTMSTASVQRVTGIANGCDYVRTLRPYTGNSVRAGAHFGCLAARHFQFTDAVMAGRQMHECVRPCVCACVCASAGVL